MGSLLVTVLAFSTAFLVTPLFGQETIPAGTILPVQLSRSVKSDKAKVGHTIAARIMQDVPLPGGKRIPAGANVLGRIESVTAADASHPAEVSLRFDTIVVHKQRIPVTTNLRTLASMMEVAEAQVPDTGPDRGTPENWWTTEQIGGQMNYHGNGLITEGSEAVGHSTDHGVLARPTPRDGCRGAVAGNEQLQAMWVFASGACGFYGYDNLVLKHAGRTDPDGIISIAAVRGNFNLRAGSGMLLRVN